MFQIIASAFTFLVVLGSSLPLMEAASRPEESPGTVPAVIAEAPALPLLLMGEPVPHALRRSGHGEAVVS